MTTPALLTLSFAGAFGLVLVIAGAVGALTAYFSLRGSPRRWCSVVAAGAVLFVAACWGLSI